MTTSYLTLNHEFLAPGTRLYQHQAPKPGSIKLDDSAELVYTDFSSTRAFTVSPTANLDAVNEKMITCAVRMLFVTDADGKLQGLVTFSDLFGDQPMRYLKEHGGTRSDILAQDIMTTLLQLEALRIEQVKKARVGDIIDTIRTAGRQHMLVCDTDESGQQIITGLFSSTHIERLVGVSIELSTRAQSFADLERALG